MASPFAPFANARLAWRRPTAPLANLRDGVAGLVSETVVIEAFLKETTVSQQDGRSGGDRATARSGGDRATAMVIDAAAVRGYITRWVVLPAGESWLAAGTAWEWDETGLRPEGFRASGAEAQLFRGVLALLPATGSGTIHTIELQHVGSAYGDGGIGAVLREAAGDQFTALLREAR